jgi:hypothetical protein
MQRERERERERGVHEHEQDLRWAWFAKSGSRGVVRWAWDSLFFVGLIEEESEGRIEEGVFSFGNETTPCTWVFL